MRFITSKTYSAEERKKALQRSIINKTNSAARYRAIFSEKPLTIEQDGRAVTNYGTGILPPMEELDNYAAEMRGELSSIAGEERRTWKNALRQQRHHERQGDRLSKLLDHNTDRKNRLLKQSDAYPPGLRKIGTIKGLKYLLSNALDFDFPTDPLLYGDREGIINYTNNNAEGRVYAKVDPTHYIEKPKKNGAPPDARPPPPPRGFPPPAVGPPGGAGGLDEAYARYQQLGYQNSNYPPLSPPLPSPPPQQQSLQDVSQRLAIEDGQQEDDGYPYQAPPPFF